VVGKWRDGRIGVMRGIRKGPYSFGITLYGQKKILNSEPVRTSYRPLLVEIVKFFQTGVPPVNPDETLEMFAFMEAADISKARGGIAVPLSEVTQ
jgi:hypothetical protein